MKAYMKIPVVPYDDAEEEAKRLGIANDACHAYANRILKENEVRPQQQA
jgi:hypothetical protein